MPVEEQVIPVASVPGDRRSQSLLQSVASFSAVLAALLVFVSVSAVRSRFSDPDMWWHLKTGEIIWKTHSIPRVDLFSFTTNHHAYVPHEWLAQLTIYAAYHFGGYSGIMLWLWVAASLMSLVGYTLCRLYSGDPKIAFLGGLGILFFATVGLSGRPQLAGYVLLLCELLIVTLGRIRNTRWFLALPALFLVWVNIHGSFLLGLIVLGTMLFCGCLDFRVGLLVSHRWSKEHRKMLGVALILSAAALFVNPVGLSQLTYPINTMFSQQIGLQYSSEWQPLSMSDVRDWAMFGMIAMILIVPLLRCVELRLEEILLVALGFVLAVKHQRMLFVFGILTLPIFCRLLAAAWKRNGSGRKLVLLNTTIIGLVLSSLPGIFPSSRELVEQENKANPVKAVEFIQRSGLSGRMLNDYIYGGYLIWAAPDHKVFVDGRADVYEWTGVLADYINLLTLKTDPRPVLAKYQIDFCLLQRQEPLARVMQLLPDWKTVYSDDRAVILARSATPGSAR